MGSAAYLILEDGTLLEGESVGSKREVISEIVFNTSMTGYLEVLTDPSYAGQAVVMTYPLIGNYGVSFEDMESSRPWLSAYIVREFSPIPSNFRSEDTIQNFLKRYDIPAISGIDTRALTKLLREKGTMNGMITCTRYSPEEIRAYLPKIRAYRTGDVVSQVTCKEAYPFTDRGENLPWPTLVGSRAELEEAESLPMQGSSSEENETISADDPALAGTAIAEKAVSRKKRQPYRVAVLDFGMKRNIGRSLARRGCQVTVWPAHTKAEEILNSQPDGIMLSNGPGDPKDCGGIIEEVRRLYQADIPIFAICLGHQLMALAAGGDTYKLKYGHRGGNHPVKDLRTGRVYISSQNHGYAVDERSLPPEVAAAAFVNVNDGTNEGMAYEGKRIFTVQFHPEACPGPQDSGYLFDRFVNMMAAARREKEV